MFRHKIPLLVTGNEYFWVYNGTIDPKKARHNTRTVISQKINKDFAGNAIILTDDESSLSILLENYNTNTSIGYSAVVNCNPIELERFYKPR